MFYFMYSYLTCPEDSINDDIGLYFEIYNLLSTFCLAFLNQYTCFKNKVL